MNFFADLAYLLSAFLFVAGLKQLSSPATARRGNQMAAAAMLIAIAVTLVDTEILTWTWIAVGIIIGSLIGAATARMVKMTAMPEMVGIFNGFGGGASALVAGAEFMNLQQSWCPPRGTGLHHHAGHAHRCGDLLRKRRGLRKAGGAHHREPGDQHLPEGSERRPVPVYRGSRRLHGRPDPGHDPLPGLHRRLPSFWGSSW